MRGTSGSTPGDPLGVPGVGEVPGRRGCAGDPSVPVATLRPVTEVTAAAGPTSGLRELGAALRRWAPDGVGVVRVLERHGFGTVESGQLVAGTAGGAVVGALYRGTLDDAVVPLAAAAVSGPHTREAHVAEAAALDAGLACAG